MVMEFHVKKPPKLLGHIKEDDTAGGAVNLGNDLPVFFTESHPEQEKDPIFFSDESRDTSHGDECKKSDQRLLDGDRGDESFECFVCHSVFDNFDNLEKHMQIHEKDNPYTCFMCKESFSSAPVLKYHITTHLIYNIENPHKCFICKHLFPSISDLRSHIRQEHVTNSELVGSPAHSDIQGNTSLAGSLSAQPQCFVCKVSFPTDSLFKHHIETIHNKPHMQLKQPGVICAKCNQTVTDLKEHNDNVHFKTYRCPKCPFLFDSFLHLVNHVQEEHAGVRLSFEGYKMYSCKLCNESFNTKGGLKCHHTMRHKEKKSYQCYLCKGIFLNPSILHLHMKNHPEADNFNICYICHASFESTDVLELHQRRSHKEEFAVRIECPQCNKTFKKFDYLKRHIAQVHTDKNQFKFKCAICGKSFFLNYLLEIHMKIHTGEKPYPCKQCDLSFLRSSQLKTHCNTVHLGIKKYQCSDCGWKFSTFTNLKRH